MAKETKPVNPQDAGRGAEGSDRAEADRAKAYDKDNEEEGREWSREGQSAAQDNDRDSKGPRRGGSRPGS